jgi:hypothetical protein
MSSALFTARKLKHWLYDKFMQKFPKGTPPLPLLESVNTLATNVLKELGRILLVIHKTALTKHDPETSSRMAQTAVRLFLNSEVIQNTFGAALESAGSRAVGKFVMRKEFKNEFGEIISPDTAEWDAAERAIKPRVYLFISIKMLARLVNKILAPANTRLTGGAAVYLGGVVEEIVKETFLSGKHIPENPEWPPATAAFIPRAVANDSEISFFLVTKWGLVDVPVKKIQKKSGTKPKYSPATKKRTPSPKKKRARTTPKK